MKYEIFHSSFLASLGQFIQVDFERKMWFPLGFKGDYCAFVASSLHHLCHPIIIYIPVNFLQMWPWSFREEIREMTNQNQFFLWRLYHFMKEFTLFLPWDFWPLTCISWKNAYIFSKLLTAKGVLPFKAISDLVTFFIEI